MLIELLESILKVKKTIKVLEIYFIIIINTRINKNLEDLIN